MIRNAFTVCVVIRLDGPVNSTLSNLFAFVVRHHHSPKHGHTGAHKIEKELSRVSKKMREHLVERERANMRVVVQQVGVVTISSETFAS